MEGTRLKTKLKTQTGIVALTALLSALGLLSLLTQAQVGNWAAPPEDNLAFTPLAAESIPQFGSFYSWQRGGPPLPFNRWPGLPVYALGDGRFLVDDRTIDYAAWQAQMELEAALAAAQAVQVFGAATTLSSPPPPPGGGGGSGTNQAPTFDPPPWSFGCSNGPAFRGYANFLSNGTVRLDWCGLEPGYRYDLLTATNQGRRHDGADVDWVTLMEIPTNVTSVTVQATNTESYFRIARLLDPDQFPPPSYYVNASAPTGGDGSKDLPYRRIQQGLNAATNGSLVLVLPGVYSANNDRNLRFATSPVILMSDRGWEQTIINCGDDTNRAFVFTASNATPQELVIIGFTISNAANSAVYCSGGSRPTFINCLFINNRSTNDGGGAIFCTNASPVFINCRFVTNTATTQGGALYAVGREAAPYLSHCTLAGNTRANGGGQVYSRSNACVTLNNCIVWGPDTMGPEIVTNTAGLAQAAWCDILNWTNGGYGNMSSNPRFEAGITLRLRTNSFCLDQGTTNTVPGFRLFTQTDMDGEARLDHATNNALSSTDIGADEFVYRIQFPTNASITWVIGTNGLYVPQTNFVSEVDESSGVAYLTNTATGPLIAIVDDEDRTGFRLYQLNADASAIAQSIPVSTLNTNYGSGGDQEIADMEGLTYDAAHRQFYLVTSQTKRNRFRDVDSTPPILDTLVDPPSNDYDRRRTVLARMQLDGTLTTVTNQTFFESDPTAVPWNSGYQPFYGLASYLGQVLTNNPALRETNRGNKVLIAWNTTNKFGTPVNGKTYATNSLLPYTNGGLYTNAGISLGFFNANGPAVGTNIHAGRTAGATYYYKIWAVDARTNYYEGPTAVVTNNGIPRIYINEFDAAGGNETVELYNPSPVPVSIAGWYLSDNTTLADPQHFYQIPAGTNIPARSVWRVNDDAWNGSFNWPDDGSLNIYLIWTNRTTRIDEWNMEDPDEGQVEFTQGRVWDGGPRGFVNIGTDFDSCKYEAHSPYPSPYPPNLNTLNLTNAYKRFDAVADADPTKIHLVWQHIGLVPAVSAYSPKQHDFHSINIEDVAYRNANEMVFGLRAPLTNRTSGNAYYFMVTNLAAFLPAGGWIGADMQGISGALQMNLGGLGIRSIKWCPNGLTNAQGSQVARYLVLAGTANGGPVQRENARQRFALYAWNGTATNGLAQPQLLISDLKGYAVRPEGVELINVNGQWRILFVEDRFQSIGYATRNAIHWPVSILGKVQ